MTSKNAVFCQDEIHAIVKRTLCLMSESNQVNFSSDLRATTLLSSFSEDFFSRTYQIGTPKTSLKNVSNQNELTREDSESLLSPKATSIETVLERRDWETKRRKSIWQLTKLVDFLLVELKQRSTLKSEEIYQFAGYIQETLGINTKENGNNQSPLVPTKNFKKLTAENLLVTQTNIRTYSPFHGLHDDFTPTTENITPQHSSPLSFTSSTISNYTKAKPTGLWNTLSPEKLPKVIKHSWTSLENNKTDEKLVKINKKTSEYDETQSPAITARTMVSEIMRNDRLLTTDYIKVTVDVVYPTLYDLATQYSEASQLGFNVLEKKNAELKESIKESIKKWKLYRPFMYKTSEVSTELDRWLLEENYFNAIENDWFKACQVTRGLCVLLEELFQLEYWHNWTVGYCFQQWLTSLEYRLEKQMDFVKQKSYEFQNRKILDTRQDELISSSPCFLSPFGGIQPAHDEEKLIKLTDFPVKSNSLGYVTPKASKYRHNMKDTRVRALLRPRPLAHALRCFTKKTESVHSPLQKNNTSQFFESIEHQELSVICNWVEKLSEIKHEDWPNVPCCVSRYPILDASIKLLKQASVLVKKRLFKHFIITSPVCVLKSEYSSATEGHFIKNLENEKYWTPTTVTLTQDKNLYFSEEQDENESGRVLTMKDMLVHLSTVENVILYMKTSESKNAVVKLEYTSKADSKGSTANKLVNSILRFDSKSNALKKHIYIKFKNHTEATSWVETIQQSLPNETCKMTEKKENDTYSDTLRQFWKMLS